MSCLLVPCVVPSVGNLFAWIVFLIRRRLRICALSGAQKSSPSKLFQKLPLSLTVHTPPSAWNPLDQLDNSMIMIWSAKSSLLRIRSLRLWWDHTYAWGGSIHYNFLLELTMKCAILSSVVIARRKSFVDLYVDHVMKGFVFNVVLYLLQRSNVLLDIKW